VESIKATIGGTEETISTFQILAATASKAGLLSAADKAKLDALWSSGYQFAGIATPSTTPISTTSKIFYIATEAGTYFNAVTVTKGINILSWNGSTWSAMQVVGIDEAPVKNSSNLAESGGVYKDVEGTVSAAYDLTNNSFVNKVLQYFYTTSSVYTGSKHFLEIAYKHNNDNRYYNRLVIQRSATQSSEVFTENYSTKEEAINAFIASPVRENSSNTIIFDVTSVTSDNSGQYEFDFIKSVAPNSNPIFDKYISPKNLFKTNMGEVLISEVLTYPNDGYKLDNILIAEFCALNNTTDKYEISLQSVFTKEGFSNIYGTLISKIGNDGFDTRDDALEYWNDNIGGHILPMADGRGYVSYNKIENIDKLPSTINTRLYLNKDTDNTENAASIMEYFNSIRKENIFKYDTKLNLLIDEFYLNPEFIDLSEIDSIRICCGGTISSKIYNLVYIYRTSSLSTRVMYQKEYETVDAALADLKGVLGNVYGKIKINDSFAKELTSGFYTDVAISDINTELLSADKCPAIESVINPHNNLIGKKVVWEGDSIAADNSWNGTGWRARIEEKYNIFGVSYAIGGSTITNNVSGLEERHNMAARVDSDVETTESCDYFIFDGGTNDADRIGMIVKWVDGSENTKYERLPQSSFPAKFGTWNDTDFSGEYDKDTFCGALEYFIWKVLSSYKGVRIGYIVAPKMGMTSSLTFFNRLEYFHEAMAICKKWGVPVINLWEDSWMNPNMPNQYQKYSDDPSENRTANVQAGNFYLDGQHPAPAGFDYLSKMIGEWMNNL
jgi:hypothetical protein